MNVTFLGTNQPCLPHSLLLLKLELPEGPRETCLGLKEAEGSPAAPPHYEGHLVFRELPEGCCYRVRGLCPPLSFHSNLDWECLHFLPVLETTAGPGRRVAKLKMSSQLPRIKALFSSIYVRRKGGTEGWLWVQLGSNVGLLKMVEPV